ncbi:hypothetical protein GGU11DRAFT_818955 [Lentinula aff. detonsa]|nr:hypothetical protein GGU11DRAFT_818955 [Lentinula aff. detonsa]
MRLKQYTNWNNDVIPRLIRPYMRLLRETSNLKYDRTVGYQRCSCIDSGGRTLSILVVRFSNLEHICLRACQCHPAAVQLVEQGLFPCAPLYPSLAVDLRVFDFAGRLFLRISPNTTAWLETLEEFLHSQGYQMKGEDPLRRRFGNALHWYDSLQIAMAKFVDSVILGTRASLDCCNELPPAASNLEDEDEEGSEGSWKRHRSANFSAPPRTRPSEYLRARCPLCFGGKSTMSDRDSSVIVCLDACFTHKHNKIKMRDPPRQHPKTVFIPETETKAWEQYVEEVRPNRADWKKVSRGDQEDGFEGPLKVLNSVLDSCEESFTAADENRQKSSTQWFDSTALMGLLCRHDRVLWLVNMTSPGERQHYALTLIDTLFQHLPLHFTVGILYDIACTLHRSCVRWKFLDQYINRIAFAISVFHAYGHGWQCQGFGLSDSEGCERFWHSISKLIAYLRVCGYYLRLHTIDSQVQHADRESLEKLATWLVRKWRQAEAIRDSGRTQEFLQLQWEAQVKAQTKPMPRRWSTITQHPPEVLMYSVGQSKNAGKNAVEEALRLRKSCDASRARVAQLDAILTDTNAPLYEVAEAELELERLRPKFKKALAEVSQKERLLGVEGKAQYRHLVSSPKIVTHTEDSIKRRDPGIQRLARSYNELHKKMVDLVRTKRAPRNAVIPSEIDMKHLFKLDVDDNIWQDIGLDEMTDLEELPLWLCDKGVRKGIQAKLELDRCNEELRRLTHERKTLREWMAEEWDVLCTTIKDLDGGSDNEDLLYQLTESKQNLLRLCVRWDSALESLPVIRGLNTWGPTMEELEEEAKKMHVEVLVNMVISDEDKETGDEAEMQEYETDESDVDDEFDEDDLDVGLVERLDALRLADSRTSDCDSDGEMVL